MFTSIGALTTGGLAADALALLQQLWELPRQNPRIPLPMPNPVSLLRQDMPQLRQQEYHVSAKLDGTRYLLLLGNHAKTGESYAVLIARNRDIYRISLESTDASAWCGTLLDCELLPDHTLVVFDVMTQCGVDCKALPYSQRMAKLPPLLPHLSPLPLRCKPFWPLRQIAAVTSAWPQDGLIFMPERAPVQTGMHRTMFKWKPEHTIDFALGTDGQLRYSTANGEKDLASLKLTLEDTPALHDAMTAAPCIVECQCHPRSQVRVLHRRPDKTVPNFERTVQLTLRNIDENLQLEELVQCYES
jgi:hypothetical protein